MGQPSLRESNEDMIARIVGQDERAGNVLRAMLAVGKESMDMAKASGAARIPHFEYMLLVSLRQNDVGAAALLTLHDKLCQANPTLTAALVADSFTTRSVGLAETARRLEAGLPIHANPMLALTNMRARYGYFDESQRPTAVVSASPREAMSVIDAASKPQFGPVTGDWALATGSATGSATGRRAPAAAEVGPPEPAHLRKRPAAGEHHAGM